jgi:hypothetical protein
VQLRHADALAPGALPANTTLLYLSNLCFPPALSRAFAARLLTLPNLQCLGALRELEPAAEHPSNEQPSIDEPSNEQPSNGEPSNEQPSNGEPANGESSAPVGPTAARAGCRLVKQRTLRVSMTWDDHARLHVYCVRCGP